MASCPICATALSDDHPGLFAEEILTNAPWSSLDSSYSYPEGSAFVVAGRDVKVLKRSMETAYDSYGSAQEGEGFIVLEVDGQLYRRDCDIDSYGDAEWRGNVRPVEATPRVVTEYDYV
ncbi:hypothetical protein ACFP2T_35850 [Plantactinospora solaniradicis]|uniref:Uncharacterized protein n=1 Tax=Plantactinospora solaniradicis TaxID=1723736 RepID=A0ABW1KJ89_9ACTN